MLTTKTKQVLCVVESKNKNNTSCSSSFATKELKILNAAIL
jgi:hypothetical protein